MEIDLFLYSEIKERYFKKKGLYIETGNKPFYVEEGNSNLLLL